MFFFVRFSFIRFQSKHISYTFDHFTQYLIILFWKADSDQVAHHTTLVNQDNIHLIFQHNTYSYSLAFLFLYSLISIAFHIFSYFHVILTLITSQYCNIKNRVLEFRSFISTFFHNNFLSISDTSHCTFSLQWQRINCLIFNYVYTDKHTEETEMLYFINKCTSTYAILFTQTVNLIALV